MVIKKLQDLQDEGKMIAFVKGNRGGINKKNLKSKAKSLEECGCNLVPLMYVSGTKAVKDGCELVTTDNQPIAKEDADSYIVIIDGQHRYKAYEQAKLDPSNLYLFEAYSDLRTFALLSVANTVSEPWKPANFIEGASACEKDNELLQACKELQEKGFSLPTISKIYTWSGCLTKSKLAGVMLGKKLNVANYDLEIGNKFLEVARQKFDEKFVAKRYLIDAVISLSGKAGSKPVLTALSKLSEEDVKEITAAESRDKCDVIREKLKTYLTAE